LLLYYEAITRRMAYVGSTQLLTSGQTWTSGTMSADRADNVTGLVFANPGGTLYIEQSADGSNWDLSESVTVVANTGQGFSKSVFAPFVRLRYVNGGADQTVFRISGKFSSAGDS